MLFALQQLLSLMTPYEDVPSLRLLMGVIATNPIIDVILAAALTWAAHSSVAVVLLIMAFAAKGVIPPHAAFAPGFGGAGRRTLFLCTTFGYGKGDPRTQHEAAMLRMEVATPGAGLP